MRKDQSLVINAKVYLEVDEYTFTKTVNVLNGNLDALLAEVARTELIKIKLRGIDYTEPIVENANPKMVRALAEALNDKDIKSIEDLYWFVYNNANENWVKNAVYYGIPKLFVFDDEEVVNQLLSDKSPWEVIHSIGRQFNHGDDYVYWTSDNLLQTMNNEQFEDLLQKVASDLLVEFCKENNLLTDVIERDAR